VEIQDVKMLTLMAGECCAGFINPVVVVAVVGAIRRQKLPLSIGRI
jgi:hypothetical protein